MLVSTPTAERWSVTDVEVLTNDSVDEAMEEYLDGIAFEMSEPTTPSQLRAEFRNLGDVTVAGYARLQVPNAAVAKRALTIMTECIEEDYGDPDGSYGDTKLSDETKTAAQMLAKSLLADFLVWRMDPVTTVEVNALDWVETNAPEWLDSKETGQG